MFWLSLHFIERSCPRPTCSFQSGECSSFSACQYRKAKFWQKVHSSNRSRKCLCLQFRFPRIFFLSSAELLTLVEFACRQLYACILLLIVISAQGKIQGSTTCCEQVPCIISCRHVTFCFCLCLTLLFYWVYKLVFVFLLFQSLDVRRKLISMHILKSSNGTICGDQSSFNSQFIISIFELLSRVLLFTFLKRFTNGWICLRPYVLIAHLSTLFMKMSRLSIFLFQFTLHSFRFQSPVSTFCSTAFDRWPLFSELML